MREGRNGMSHNNILNVNKPLTEGQSVIFGKYYISSESRLESIEWTVLKKEKNKCLLITKSCIDWLPFHTPAAVTWEKSNIRALLNDYFYNLAFSKDEKKIILKSKIFTSDKTSCDGAELHKDCGNPTYDHVFLLSASEAESFFQNDEKRKADATPYAQARGAYVSPDCNGCVWWLRSRGYNVSYSSDVFPDGEICLSGDEVYEESGIRPVLWISV